MKNEELITGLMNKIRRSYPDWPSTFGSCINDCDGGRLARGSGECPDCLEKKLAELVGEKKARKFHKWTRKAARVCFK